MIAISIEKSVSSWHLEGFLAQKYEAARTHKNLKSFFSAGHLYSYIYNNEPGSQGRFPGNEETTRLEIIVEFNIEIKHNVRTFQSVDLRQLIETARNKYWYKNDGKS